MEFWLDFLLIYGLPFILGGVVIGCIVNAINQRDIRDLKVLLRGFGVLREERPRWFWSKRWGISFGRR